MLQRSAVVAVISYLWCGLATISWAQLPGELGTTFPTENRPAPGVVQATLPTTVLEQLGVPGQAAVLEPSVSVLRENLPVLATAPLPATENIALLLAGQKEQAAAKDKDSAVWFTSMSGLVMTRDRANNVDLSFGTGLLTPTLLSTQDASMEWGGGFDIRFGRFFNNRQQAWEVVYWGLFADAEIASAVDPGAADLNTTFQFDSLSYNGLANPVAGFFNGAARHQLVRDHEFHNIEVNLWGNTNGLKKADGLQVGWLAGIRFFRFRDSLKFMSDSSDGVFTGAVDEVTYSMDTQNRLLGVQLGGLAQHGLSDRWSLHGGIKVGFFGNHVTNSSQIGGAAGNAFVDDINSPFDQHHYRLHNHKDDVAMLGEIDLGATFQIREHWRAFLGFRAAALTGVGLSTNQFPTDFSNLTEAAEIRSNGSLILHGGYAGIELLY
jgi:hypothetical protein